MIFMMILILAAAYIVKSDEATTVPMDVKFIEGISELTFPRYGSIPINKSSASFPSLKKTQFGYTLKCLVYSQYSEVKCSRDNF